MTGLEYIPAGIIVVVLGNLLSDIITASWVVWRTKRVREQYVRMIQESSTEDSPTITGGGGYR